MIDPMGGGGSRDQAARAAAEAARRAAAEAARRAARERARAAAAERMRDQTAPRIESGPFTASPSGVATASRAATFSPADAARLTSAAAPALQEGGGPSPLGSDHVPVLARPADGAEALADNWLRAGKSQIGMGSTAVYDAYMSRNRLGLDQMARILSPQTAPSVDALLEAGDTEGYVNRLAAPALAAMGDLHPEASFELLVVEHGALGTSMPGPHQIYSPQTVLRMTEDGQTRDYVLDASRLFRPSLDDGVHDALVATPGGLGAWGEAEARLEWDQGDPQATWDALSSLSTDGSDFNITRGLMTMDPTVQTEFLKEYGQTSEIPLGVQRPVDEVPADAILLTVDADPLARSGEAAALVTTVHKAAVDGLAGSTALPPIGDVDPQQWRATLDALATQPPAGLADLRTQLQQLSGGTITGAVLDELAADDPGALPALLNLVQDHPPAVSFNETLNLSLVAGGEGVAATYESITYDPVANVAVVDTSLNLLIGDSPESARLAETYGVGDLPMTVRIPLPEGAPSDWSSPTADHLELLNQQIQDIGSAAVFLHGYQSDRRVWATDMQRWMNLSAEPTIGIAFAGMGSEGDFLGSGDSPLTAKQYAFHTMEALDVLGLYGKDINLYGHSMGGAAVLQAGLATDRMVDGGATRPTVNYVLLQPAPTGDSVPFLTEGFLSGVINAQTNVGAAGWLGNAASQFTNWVGSGTVVNHLIPGAPEYIQDVHESFAGSGGFDQLKATAQGLVLQAEPDPAEVRAFLAANHVLVVAGSQDRIVSTDAVRGLFDGQVYEVPGNHYAHLPSEIAEENHFGDVEERLREFLAEPSPGPAVGPGGRRGPRRAR
jgi:hypothetical protein